VIKHHGCQGLRPCYCITITCICIRICSGHQSRHDADRGPAGLGASQLLEEEFEAENALFLVQARQLREELAEAVAMALDLAWSLLRQDGAENKDAEWCDD
jgi:hypothetical protein